MLKLNVHPREEGTVGFCLSEGSVVTIESGPEGGAIRVVEGEFWVTQEDDREDHRLRAGDAILIHGPVVLQALAASQVRVGNTPRARPAPDRLAALAGSAPGAAKLPSSDV